ncbi:MAG: hypothetical protein GHCLOJNM_02377 [bacterium]|nr:hypothetical protein [bacterium]
MSFRPNHKYTPEEYLALEREAQSKSEYYAGEVFAMSGATEAHVLIVGNVFAKIHAKLMGRSCKVYMSDMRVKVSETGMYTYPDLSALRGEPRFEDNLHDTLLNPTVLIEVLSKSTESYDRGARFGHYRAIESLQEYVLVSQESPRVELFTRQPRGGWLLTDAIGLEASLRIASLDCDLPLAEVYDKVTFEVPAEFAGSATPR